MKPGRVRGKILQVVMLVLSVLARRAYSLGVPGYEIQVLGSWELALSPTRKQQGIAKTKGLGLKVLHDTFHTKRAGV